MTRDHSLTARGLLLWCLGAALAIDAFLRYAPFSFSAIFAQLLATGDTMANWLLLALAAAAYALRRHAGAILAAIRIAGSRPWLLAAALFPLLCLGTLRVYHDQPLSMDEYAVLFQAKAFAAGRLGGVFPPELMDALIPHRFQNVFLAVSRTTGEVSSGYWPGFALLLAPFAWLDLAWAANPLISVLTLPAVHRLTRQVTGSSEAAAWAVLLMLASPVFTVDAMSYYSMPASLLLNALFALLLLQPTATRAAAAGFVGSIALTLHQPVPHFLFALPFAVWLLARADRWRLVLPLAAGYLPLSLLLGLAWQDHLVGLLSAGHASQQATAAEAPPLLDTIIHRVGTVIVLPGEAVTLARVAGVTKIWTWAAAGLLALSACGLASARMNTSVRVLAAAALTTFVGYFFFPFDQGHGWGFRYFHSAWFILPMLAGLYAARVESGGEARGMVAWLVALSLLFANGQRLVEVESFIRGQLEQVPPLAQPAPRDGREIIFVRSAGFYVEDLVQNDPLLRGTRIVMVSRGEPANADLMARHFPGYARRSSGDWGERWTAPLSAR